MCIHGIVVASAGRERGRGELIANNETSHSTNATNSPNQSHSIMALPQDTTAANSTLDAIPTAADPLALAEHVRSLINLHMVVVAGSSVAAGLL